MKNVKFFMASVCVVLLAVSCLKNSEEFAPIREKAQLTTITCAFPSIIDQNGTKVSLATTGATGWEVGDKMVIYGNPSSSDETKRVVHEIVAGDIADPDVAVFEVDFSGLDAQNGSDPEGTYYPYTVAYPYTDGQPYYLGTGSGNYGRSRFQNTNQLLMAGYVTDDNSSIVLNHITAAITFSVDGDFDSYTFSGKEGTEVVGYSSLVVEMNRRSGTEGRYRQKFNNSGTTGPLTSIQGSVNGNGTAVNYIFLPVNAQKKDGGVYDLESQRYADVVYLPNGFTIKFFKGGELKKYITAKAPLIIDPGHMINLGKLPAEALHDAPTSHDATHPAITGAENLGASETANCYIVDGSKAANNGKVFKFKAVKGNSNTSVGAIDNVVVLWETYNNAEEVSANSIIAEADFDKQDGDDDYWITFKMPATITPGNAVIAAKSSSGEILWSWHIWVPATSVQDVGEYAVSPKYFMDRNLGALVVAEAKEATVNVQSFGMLYQWGRKDPFVGAKAFNNTSFATVAGLAQDRTDDTSFDLDASYAHPTTFANYSAWRKGVAEWNPSGNKSIDDPCPVGYKVPDYNSSHLLWGNIPAADGFSASAEYGWWKYGQFVFPMAGYSESGSSVAHAYDRCRILTSTMYVSSSTDEHANSQYIYDNSGVWTHVLDTRKRYGASVRCVKIEGEVPEPEVDPITPGPTSITIDGSFTDWAGVEAKITSASGPYFEFKVAYDATNVYFYSKRNFRNDYWANNGYFYYMMDLDHNKATQCSDPQGVEGVDTWVFIYPFGGTNEAPALNTAPAGSTNTAAYQCADNSLAGVIGAETVETEICFPRAAFGIENGMAIKFYSWGSKSASNIKTEAIYLKIEN